MRLLEFDAKPGQPRRRQRRFVVGTLILVRHGESLWNESGKYQGQQDIALSPEGIRQAEALAEFFRPWKFDAIYASDLARARDTAKAIAKYHALPVILDRRLREYAFGVWEGLTRAEIENKYKELYIKRVQNIDTPIPGGEIGTQMRERAMEWLREITAAYAGTVLAVSHSGTIRTLIAGVLDVDITKCHRLRISNCGYSTVCWHRSSSRLWFTVEGINCLPWQRPQ